MELYIKSLIQQVSALNNRYQKINELSGENFNVFRLLKMEASEVRMHSAFLAELLNPIGSHGQKDVFLRLFIEAFCFKENCLDSASCKVEVEKHTAFMNEERTEGGRIDIIITDRANKHIIIENKIYAGDQEKQLLRYYNYSNTADLFYLTLNGNAPENGSKVNLEEGIHFKSLSYRRDILDWLEKCRKEVAVLPIIRESISQYINLIKFLTNQTLNDTMNEEVINLITKDKEGLNAAFIIANSINDATVKLLEPLSEIVAEIATELDLVSEFTVDMKKNYTGFTFYKKDWQFASIAFQFFSYDKNFVFGIARDEECKDLSDKLTVDVADRFKYLNGKTSTWWPFYKNMESPYYDWRNKEPWLSIMDGSTKGVIKEKVVQLLNGIGDYRL